MLEGKKYLKVVLDGKKYLKVGMKVFVNKNGNVDTMEEIKGDKVKLGMDVKDKSALKVGMNIGVKMGSAIDIGEIISIEDGFVRVRHPSKSVSSHPIGFFEFVKIV